MSSIHSDFILIHCGGFSFEPGLRADTNTGPISHRLRAAIAGRPKMA